MNFIKLKSNEFLDIVLCKSHMKKMNAKGMLYFLYSYFCVPPNVQLFFPQFLVLPQTASLLHAAARLQSTRLTCSQLGSKELQAVFTVSKQLLPQSGRHTVVVRHPLILLGKSQVNGQANIKFSHTDEFTTLTDKKFLFLNVTRIAQFHCN